MCNGYKEPVTVHEFGLKKEALRCVNCGQYRFEPDIKQELVKCKHGTVDIYCGICERVANRKVGKAK